MADVGDEKEVQKKKLIAKDVENQRYADLRVVMGNKSGRRYVWYILIGTGINDLSYNPNDGDRDMNFREGHRFVGLTLRADLMAACKDLYLIMLKENEL